MHLLAAAGGNPLFAEEYVRMVLGRHLAPSPACSSPPAAPGLPFWTVGQLFVQVPSLTCKPWLAA